jgi:hypothetical protein
MLILPPWSYVFSRQRHRWDRFFAVKKLSVKAQEERERERVARQRRDNERD